ncbi:hypothetical protein [Cupriavidus sp. PET2-C1]
MALSTAGAMPMRAPANRKVFDLLLISGSLLILIDGIDELLSMMSSSFELVPFVESIKALNAELGQTRVFLAGREDTVGTTVSSLRRHGVPIDSLKGFTSGEVAQYVKKRFFKRSTEEREAIVTRVQETLKFVSSAMSDDTVFPLFVDALCQLEEDVTSNGLKLKVEGAVFERMAEAEFTEVSELLWETADLRREVFQGLTDVDVLHQHQQQLRMRRVDLPEFVLAPTHFRVWQEGQCGRVGAVVGRA